MKIAGVILAAGQSTRMGEVNKLTTVWNGRPLVSHVLAAVQESPLDDVIVVTGHQRSEVKTHLSGVKTVHNPDFATGMASSIAAGIRSVEDADAAMVLLGDMPLVSSQNIAEMLDAYDGQASSIVVATCNGKLGNPVLFGRGYFKALAELTGDSGARSIIKDASAVTKVEIGEAAKRDFDTPDAFMH